MDYKLSLAALLAVVVAASVILPPISVAGQSSSGEIRVDPGDVSLEKGETKTIKIIHDSLSAANPKGIEFVLEYDPDVISVVDANKGGYLANAFGTGPTTSSGKVEFGYTQTDPVNADSGTVATITIELADGVPQGDTTDLTFTKAKTIGTDGSPQKVDGAVEAVESTAETPENTPNYNVQIVDPTLSPTTVDDSPGDHTLNFDVENVSANNERDNITVTLPDSVAVEDITNTTVTTTNGEVVELVSDDPATLPDPGNEISLGVNPIATTETQTLTVEIELTLSAAP